MEYLPTIHNCPPALQHALFEVQVHPYARRYFHDFYSTPVPSNIGAPFLSSSLNERKADLKKLAEIGGWSFKWQRDHWKCIEKDLFWHPNHPDTEGTDDEKFIRYLSPQMNVLIPSRSPKVIEEGGYYRAMVYSSLSLMCNRLIEKAHKKVKGMLSTNDAKELDPRPPYPANGTVKEKQEWMRYNNSAKRWQLERTLPLASLNGDTYAERFGDVLNDLLQEMELKHIPAEGVFFDAGCVHGLGLVIITHGLGSEGAPCAVIGVDLVEKMLNEFHAREEKGFWLPNQPNQAEALVQTLNRLLSLEYKMSIDIKPRWAA